MVNTVESGFIVGDIIARDYFNSYKRTLEKEENKGRLR